MHKSRSGDPVESSAIDSTRSRKGVAAPLDVVQNHDERCLFLEQLAERPGDLVGARPDLRLTLQRSDRRRRNRVRRQHGELFHDLNHGPIRDAVPVRKTAAANDAGLDRSQRLRHQPRLANSRIAHNGHQFAGRLRLRAIPRLHDLHQLLFASDEPQRMASLRHVKHRDQSECRHRLRLALQLQRRDRLRDHGLAHERVCRLPDQHLARRGGLLEPGSHVHRVTRGESLRCARDDLAGVQADATADPELRQHIPHLHCGPARSERVVLVRLRDAEHGHHRVADELLHRPTMRLDDPLHPLEIPGQQSPQCFWIRRLAERGRAGDVAEQHRHRLALLPVVAGQRRGAEPAELEAFGVLLAASGACRHVGECR
jgi:hypothetical protein